MARRTVSGEMMLTRSEAAAIFGVNPKTVTGWANSGRLTPLRTLGGHRRYRAAEVQEMLKRSRSARLDH